MAPSWSPTIPSKYWTPNSGYRTVACRSDILTPTSGTEIVTRLGDASGLPRITHPHKADSVSRSLEERGYPPHCYDLNSPLVHDFAWAWKLLREDCADGMAEVEPGGAIYHTYGNLTAFYCNQDQESTHACSVPELEGAKQRIGVQCPGYFSGGYVRVNDAPEGYGLKHTAWPFDCKEFGKIDSEC